MASLFGVVIFLYFFIVIQFVYTTTSTVDAEASDVQNEIEEDEESLLIQSNNKNYNDDVDNYIYKDQFIDKRRQIDHRTAQQQQQRRGMNDVVKLKSNVYHHITKESIDPKLGQILSILVDIRSTTGPPTRTDSLFLNSSSFVLIDENIVLIDVVGNVDVLNKTVGSDNSTMKALLMKDGYEVINCVKNICSMYVPISELVALARFNYIHMIRPALPTVSIGKVTSEGDIAMLSDQVRSTYNVNGSGSLIGVMSDTYNCLNGASQDIRTNDLPRSSNIIIVSDFNVTECESRSSDEGRAMMQLIYDVAPGARLAFRTAFRGPSDFATGIRELANIGCDIIVDDVSYSNEPFYQDGIIAQAVDEVVTGGIMYFSSMGNSGMNSWDAPNGFVRSGESDSDGEFHRFGTVSNGEPILYQLLYIPNIDTDLRFSFQWSEPFYSVSGGNGSRSDLDIYFVYDGTIVAEGVDRNVGNDPYDFFTFNPFYSTLSFDFVVDIQMYIQLYAGPPPTDMKLLCFGCPSIDIVFEYGTPGTSTGYGHANSALGAGVGAAPYSETPEYGVTPPEIESFSSFGGTPILFDTLGNLLPFRIIRQQPRFTGPDGGVTTFFGDDENRFFGTSAAAPHVAAVAALLLQGAGGRRSLSPAAVYKILQDTAVDMDDESTDDFDVGFDFNTGYGFVNASAAFQALRLAKTPNRTPTRRPTKSPTRRPTRRPTKSPIRVATKAPTKRPTKSPVTAPVLAPIVAPVPVRVIPAPTPVSSPIRPFNKAPATAPLAIPVPRTAPVQVPIIVLQPPVPVKSMSDPMPLVPTEKKTPVIVPIAVPIQVPVPVLTAPVVVPIPTKNVPVLSPSIPIALPPIQLPVISSPIPIALPPIQSPVVAPKIVPVLVPNTTPRAPIITPIVVPVPSPRSILLTTAPIRVPIPLSKPKPVPVKAPISSSPTYVMKPPSIIIPPVNIVPVKAPISSPTDVKPPIPVKNVPIAIPLQKPKKRKMNNKKKSNL